jgi:hypothetical protein
MRSRFLRVLSGVIALLAFAASAFLIVNSEKQLAERRGDARAFDQHARETKDLIAELRSAQQGYVAAGQNRDFWLPKAETAREQAIAKATALRAEVGSTAAKISIDKANEALDDFKGVDARVREYLAGGQDLMAADVVYTEGGTSLATAQQEIESARAAEQQALDASETDARKREGVMAAGAGVVGILVIALLALTGATAQGEGLVYSTESSAPASRGSELPLNFDAVVAGRAPARAESALLKAAAELCTDFGRVRDQHELTAVLGRAAHLMEANGLVVWLGSTAGADLTPVLAHGYSPQALAHMPAVPRSADNAAASAYRTSHLQIVLSKPGSNAGAVVAPLLAPEGCIGALSIEIKGGGETSDAIQAMSGIFAAQLAGILAASTVEGVQSEPRAAAANS